MPPNPGVNLTTRRRDIWSHFAGLGSDYSFILGIYRCGQASGYDWSRPRCSRGSPKPRWDQGKPKWSQCISICNYSGDWHFGSNRDHWVEYNATIIAIKCQSPGLLNKYKRILYNFPAQKSRWNLSARVRKFPFRWVELEISTIGRLRWIFRRWLIAWFVAKPYN